MRYEVQHRIAVGGMGAVYRVRDRVSGELQAMKRVSFGDPRSRAYAVEAFEREYHVLASLDHPRIIRVFDYGVDEQGPFYTMELLEGQDMRRLAPLPYRRACMYLRDVATSLVLLHTRRVLHRDLSPTNVRVTPDGHCKLFDFGALAEFGSCPHVVGTPPLIAPEALQGAPLDQRTDLYALGALAYWMLTGKHAFPARSLSTLPDHWQAPPPPPSSYVDVPAALDLLVQSLLNRSPNARPRSAAEVIARLDVIAELEPEDNEQTTRLANSYFAFPRFTGRHEALITITERINAAVGGSGAALQIEAEPGMGRTRLLDEVAIQGRLAGATVIAADASMSRQLQGTAQALVERVFELMPELAAEHSRNFRVGLAALGQRVERRSLPPPGPDAAAANTQSARPPPPLAEFFAQISRHKPLLIAVDNVEDADDASQGLLASLASLAPRYPLLLVVTRTHPREASVRLGDLTLARHAQRIELTGLSNEEMLELLRSIFGDAPNVERIARWLHERTAGSPLHAIEVCRRLLARGAIRYASGLWTLPSDQPDAELPAELGDTLLARLDDLSRPGRALAECLSLQQGQPTLSLCTALCADADDPSAHARELLDELTRADVLHAERNGYRFNSSALRGALVQGLDDERLEQDHRRLGEALARDLDPEDLATRIEAGFHLIEGAEKLRGADMIASATHDSSKFRTLIANLYRAGRPVESALEVYRRHRRSPYQRLPLLAALAHAGYYEDRHFGEHYGDEALDMLEDLSGLRSARRLRPFVGSMLALLIGLALAYLRFAITPRQLRPYPFREILLHLFGAVTTLAGTAALSLDAERARNVAAVLQPFAFLPERTTPVGIYQFCNSLGEIARENEANAYATFERLQQRFDNPHYYPTLPREARAIFLAGVHFARGSFAVFSVHGQSALDSADALEAIGFKLYAMIASQLRYLYYIARGEFAKAAPHRDQVELHAAHLGSVWQVETWEAAALLLINAIAIGDVVSTTRLSHQLEAASQRVPSLKRYSRLAKKALVEVHRDKRYLHDMRTQVQNDPPRSYIGWAAAMSAVVRSYNHIGEFGEAKAVAERVCQHVTEADREFVALFLPLDLQHAIADAGLGHVDAALSRLDNLLARFADCDHPLLQGLLHETRANVCWQAGRVPEYEHSRAQAERWLRPTQNDALIARCERVQELATLAKPSRAPDGEAASQADDTSVTVSESYTPGQRHAV